MQQPTYLKARNELIDNFKKGLKLEEDENLFGQYNMVSTALVNYLPTITVDKHETIYKDILLHQKLSILEQSTYKSLDFVEMENCTDEILNLLKNGPSIISTFHTGSYRLINLFLMKNKIPYSLVVGKNVVEQEGEAFKKIYSSLPGNAGGNNFDIIDAENASVGLQMLRAIKNGRSLLLYMDGNTGAGAATTKNDNRCKVDFLGQQIFARKGIAFLSHAANIPIVTVTGYRASWNNIRLKFFDPIFPDAGKERGLFAEETTQKMYDLVAPIIEKYPEQWEAWLYIHKVANIINPDRNQTVKRVSRITEKIALDSFRFGIFKLAGASFLLKKSNYSFYEINNKLYDFLAKCTNEPVKKDCIDYTLFNQLYEQGVIQYV
jgi:lauroyl/myristoyl acyltransferase